MEQYDLFVIWQHGGEKLPPHPSCCWVKGWGASLGSPVGYCRWEALHSQHHSRRGVMRSYKMGCVPTSRVYLQSRGMELMCWWEWWELLRAAKGWEGSIFPYLLQERSLSRAFLKKGAGSCLDYWRAQTDCEPFGGWAMIGVGGGESPTSDMYLLTGQDVQLSQQEHGQVTLSAL